MSLTFYPSTDDVADASAEDRIGIFMEAAERYKAAVLDVSKVSPPIDDKHKTVPKDLAIAFNWGEIARLLGEVRTMPESSKVNKLRKLKMLTNLAEIYEVLRGAKMPKLEAVRLALLSEANQLRGEASQVA